MILGNQIINDRIDALIISVVIALAVAWVVFVIHANREYRKETKGMTRAERRAYNDTLREPGDW